MKPEPRVEIVIDELILHGFSPSDRDAIGDSLSRELGRLVEAGGLAALSGLEDAPVLHTPTVSLQPGARAGSVGTRVAQAVHASLGGPGQGGLEMSAHLQKQPAAAKPTPASVPANFLQRQCACGEQDDMLKKRGLQAKLTVNRPGDRWEQEADRVADSVMSGRRPSPGPARGPALMRSTGPGPVPGEAPAGVRAVLRSPGKPLEAGTRTFMEDRFGFDFGRVHIHDDPLAAHSAHELNALAYTVGQEVVFGAGQYAPGTEGGRRLLAHELAHTVQQDSGTQVRRETASLAVKGLYEERGEAKEKKFVYFDLDSPAAGDNPPESVLDADERTKIENQTREALAAKAQEISLYGFASEEGGAATNNPLIQRRMTAVQNVINDVVQKAGASAIQVHMNNRLSCSTDKYDYRYWRAVEIQPGKSPQTRLCASPEATSCPPDRMTKLAGIRASSMKLLEGPTGVITRLENYIKKPTDEPDVLAALDQFFAKDHTAKTAEEVRKRMVAIRDFIRDMDTKGHAVSKCGSEDEPTCHAGGEAAANDTVVLLCPSFFDRVGKTLEKEGTLIHEASHGSKYATDDRAYQWERAFPILSTQQALANADSLSGFVMQLSGGFFEKGPEHADVVTGCDPKGQQLVQEAIALAQRWNLYALTGTAQTYDNAQNRAAMSPFHMAHFGRDDKAAIAGMYDKYSAMNAWFTFFYNISCAKPGEAACPGSRPVQWNLTRAATPASGGPVPEPKSEASSTTPGSTAGSTAGSTTTSTVPPTGTTTQSQPAGNAPGASTATPAPTGNAPQATTAAPAVAAGDITVCPDFFKLGTLYDRVVEMHSGLAVHLPGVTEATSRSYARLAFNYKTNFWKVPD